MNKGGMGQVGSRWESSIYIYIYICIYVYIYTYIY